MFVCLELHERQSSLPDDELPLQPRHDAQHARTGDEYSRPTGSAKLQTRHTKALSAPLAARADRCLFARTCSDKQINKQVASCRRILLLQFSPPLSRLMLMLFFLLLLLPLLPLLIDGTVSDSVQRQVRHANPTNAACLAIKSLPRLCVSLPASACEFANEYDVRLASC